MTGSLRYSTVALECHVSQTAILYVNVRLLVFSAQLHSDSIPKDYLPTVLLCTVQGEVPPSPSRLKQVQECRSAGPPSPRLTPKISVDGWSRRAFIYHPSLSSSDCNSTSTSTIHHPSFTQPLTQPPNRPSIQLHIYNLHPTVKFHRFL